MTKILLATGVALVAAQLFSVPAIAGDTPNTLRRATERACIHESRQQGLIVQRVGKVEAVSDNGRRIMGTRAAVWVKRGGDAYRVRCDYSPADRVATITPMQHDGSA